ncbi:lytic polysaccharide monooxygenase [Streptomyces sp. NBC_00102]|uniref:lytic polysaccharide monooxygenase auxiliary activity family 9 protein n=1 Tax=Streptomyces sp. NBC_00102 TaxID=2975652 RepID=UPI002252C837|nr:lytic polysaccharide monooxygenase [Streptomyces sp. NBC_00102]MCX5402314.1 lytic polysaccharide monooxygenase [Streptomyces sp. NBC_00102]
MGFTPTAARALALAPTLARRVAPVLALGVAPLSLTVLLAGPAVAHGTLTDPVSRVSACYAEGPENPKSAACKAAVAAGGTQALYDWNGVNLAAAAGKHREVIPDGKLCSAGNDKFKGLDLPRADWPSSPMNSGKHTFAFRATAPHKGTFELYLTKPGYDPTQPLTWADLQDKPFATATDPQLVDGSYIFDGTVPQASGRQLIYTIWQRSDSTEAFYACSDVVFGGGSSSGGAAAPAASAPSEAEIEAGAAQSSVEHQGHGDDDAATNAEVTEAHPAGSTDASAHHEESAATPTGAAATPTAASSGSAAPTGSGSAGEPVSDEALAETGGSGTTPYLAVGGAAAVAIGTSTLFASLRRRSNRAPAGR